MVKVVPTHSENFGSAITHEPLIKPQLFIRHHIQLRATVQHAEAWFCARDIGRLMGLEINARQVLKLDEDQRRMMRLSGNDGAREFLMLSESGVYAMLVYHYSPENRHLRRWLTHEIVPMLRQSSKSVPDPHLRLIMCAGETLRLLHWRNEPWIRMRDMPYMLTQEGASYR
ncbi:Bro-N domain-containing protein [Pseudomonas sp. SCA2728.1_7]|uniref:BRO-N domain-containing protein n=1 Tax=Pseudomonas sp. SCA2728.1_7 TaxID=2825975 RepID=UPI001BB06A0E|nr:Bro-N domain-containing protein [Pseudomonas sp. SCA2728.1_7]QUE89387.1 Bro-N domain-containing protein [Pseudomonas sp. SCA2728.1_7]